MRTFYLILTKHKDIFALIISIVLSLIMLSNGESDNLRLLRSKANSILTRIYTPITWIRTMSLIEEEASLLREKNLQLSFQLEMTLKLPHKSYYKTFPNYFIKK